MPLLLSVLLFLLLPLSAFSQSELEPCQPSTEQSFQNCSFSGVQFDNQTFQEADFGNASFQNVSFEGATFQNANFTWALFQNADLNGANFEDYRGVAAEEEARTRNFVLDVIRYIALGIGILALVLGVIRPMVGELSKPPELNPLDRRNDLSQKSFAQANMKGIVLSYSDWIGTDLTEAHLEKADLQCGNFNDALLESACLNGALLNNSSFVKTSLEEAQLKNAEVPFSNFLDANLEQVNFQRANLEGAVFEGCDLSHANLKNANLAHAKFTQCNFKGADLTGAQILETSFSDSLLKGSIWTDGQPYSLYRKILATLQSTQNQKYKK